MQIDDSIFKLHDMVKRDSLWRILRLATKYPVITVTGPRQSGKTTLCKTAFPKKPYVSLENLDEREFANSDPRNFLKRFPDGAILDEVQRTPGIVSYLQEIVDNDIFKFIYDNILWNVSLEFSNWFKFSNLSAGEKTILLRI